MEYKKISIVVPTYNGGKFIKKAIDSVLAQNYPNTELVVVDGGSKDNTVELLKSYGDKLRWVSERDEGQTDAINKGLGMVSGEICAYINADDFYEPGVFFEMAEVFQKNPEVVLVYGNCRMLYENGKSYVQKPDKQVTAKKLINRGNMVFQPGSFYRTSAVMAAGKFNKAINYWMDYDICIKLLKQGKSHYLDRALATFLVRQEQKSGEQNRIAMDKEALLVSRSHGGKHFSRLYFAILKNRLLRRLTSLFKH